MQPNAQQQSVQPNQQQFRQFRCQICDHEADERGIFTHQAQDHFRGTLMKKINRNSCPILRTCVWPNDTLSRLAHMAVEHKTSKYSMDKLQKELMVGHIEFTTKHKLGSTFQFHILISQCFLFFLKNLTFKYVSALFLAEKKLEIPLWEIP